MTEQQYAEIAKRRAPRKRGWLRRWLRRGLFGVIGLVLVTVSAGVTYDKTWSERAWDERSRRWDVHDPFDPPYDDTYENVHPEDDGIPFIKWAAHRYNDAFWTSDNPVSVRWKSEADWQRGLPYRTLIEQNSALPVDELVARLQQRVDYHERVFKAVEAGLRAVTFAEVVGYRLRGLDLLANLMEARRVFLALTGGDVVGDWLDCYRLTEVCDHSIASHFSSDITTHVALLAELERLLNGGDPHALPLDALTAKLEEPTSLTRTSLREYWGRREYSDREFMDSEWSSVKVDGLLNFLFMKRKRASIDRCYRMGIEALNADNPRPLLERVYDAFDADVPRIRCHCCGTYAPYLYESYLRLAGAAAYLHVAKLAVGQLRTWRDRGSFDAALPADVLVDAFYTVITYAADENGFRFEWNAPWWSNLAETPTPRTVRWTYALPEGVSR